MENEEWRITIRLGDIQEVFVSKLKEKRQDNPKFKASTLMRWCVREALEQKDINTVSPEQADVYLNELREIKRQLSKVGGNLNQIAQYFNIHDHLVESDLRKRHEETQILFKQLIKTLKVVENGFIRRQY